MFPVYLIGALGILVLYLLFTQKQKREEKEPETITTYRCDTCNDNDCVCTMEEETDDK